MIEPRRLHRRSFQRHYASLSPPSPTLRGHIIALVVVHLQIEHSLHHLPHIHSNRLLEAESALIPMRSRGIGSRGENHFSGRSLEGHVEPASKSMQKSYE